MHLLVLIIDYFYFIIDYMAVLCTSHVNIFIIFVF